MIPNAGDDPKVFAREVIPLRGDLVYYDSFAGLVPCKITSIATDRGIIGALKVTATRGAYKRGETIAYPGDRYVIPRDLVYRRSGIAYIRAFRWVRGETVGERGVF